VVLPIVISVVCFGGAFGASIRWLPPLADNPVGTFAGFAVAALFGVAGAVIGLELYEMVRDLRDLTGTGDSIPGSTKSQIVSDHIRAAGYEGGVVAGLACIVYLLAPQGMPRSMHQRG
jgi:hypothetical protein